MSADRAPSNVAEVTSTADTVPVRETHRFDVEKKTVEVANRALGQR